MKNAFITGFVIIAIATGMNVHMTNSEARVLPHQGYDLLAKVLREHVNGQGRVDYEGLLANRADLDAFVNQIADTNISEMSQDEKITFWINAYNALTLHTIIEHYPVRSIRLINFGFVWKIDKNVAGGRHSLGDIEHKILRPMGDPRIHFALNCASIGCPKLPNVVFDAQHLDEQLDHETRRFMNDPQKVRLDRTANILYHSELFNWYEEDFLVVVRDKVSYIKKYLNEDDTAYLQSHPVKLKRIKYDWGLNTQ